MSDTLDRIVPEAGPKGEALYRHDAEGMQAFNGRVLKLEEGEWY
jgi:hypothetical protein